MPATVLATATAVPSYRYTQAEIARFARRRFRRAGLEWEPMRRIFRHARIRSRRLSMPIEWFERSHSIEERSRVYRRVGLDLLVRAARRCLKAARTPPSAIDEMLVVSTTGMCTPTLDAPAVDRLGLSSHTRRLPVWGLGCAGGVAGLARAMDLARAGGSNVLLVALETCSLTFQAEDPSKANFVATALFGDGAAAALVSGRNAAGPITLERSYSTTLPGTEGVMGWDFNAEGMKVRFSSRIPSIVARRLRGNLGAALRAGRWSREDLRHFLLHPGGTRVLEAFEAALGLRRDRTALAWRILREYGNMSSPTVLFVLDAFLRGRRFRTDELGVLTALGPGFSIEHLFFRCGAGGGEDV